MIEIGKGVKLAKEKKKLRLGTMVQKTSVSGALQQSRRLHQQLDAAISREAAGRVIVTSLFGWELLLSAIQHRNQKALG